MGFRYYREEDYEAVCDFLIELNRAEKACINWNWARFEWMYEHPEFDKSLIRSIGIWTDSDRVVGAAVYDMYFGEAFCAALPGYEALYPEILDYAWTHLRDENGLGIAIRADQSGMIAAAVKAGFVRAEQREIIMSLSTDRELEPELPDGMRFIELDPVAQSHEFQWLLWQGFDHGNDREEFKKQECDIKYNRRHFDLRLSVAAQDPSGETAAYCCLWYSEKTDYTYVEPVCTVPSYRGKGVAKAVIFEALNRARALGAKRAYVISDMAFYEKLGFEKTYRFDFYWKKEETK